MIILIIGTPDKNQSKALNLEMITSAKWEGSDTI